MKPTNGSVYLLCRICVARLTGGYNATDHDYIIYMSKWTEACRINNPPVEPSLFYFNLCELEDLGTIIRGTRLVVGYMNKTVVVFTFMSTTFLCYCSIVNSQKREEVSLHTLRENNWKKFQT